MIYRTFSPLILAACILLAAPVAFAGEKPAPLDGRATMDFEIMGAAEAYHDVAVPLPLSFYADEAKELRRAFLPAAGASGHTLREVQAKQAGLEKQITERLLEGRTNNPHTEADWRRRLKIWKKVEARIVAGLDEAVRKAAKRGDTVLVEHGVRSFATLEAEADAAFRRLQLQGLMDATGKADEAHARVAHRVRDSYAKAAARDLQAKKAPSFTGVWSRKGSSWGIVRLKMTSRTTLTGTWDGGKRGRKLQGVLLDDGITMRITYWDGGKPQPTKYKCRVAKDGMSIQLWSNWLDADTLPRR